MSYQIRDSNKNVQEECWEAIGWRIVPPPFENRATADYWAEKLSIVCLHSIITVEEIV